MRFEGWVSKRTHAGFRVHGIIGHRRDHQDKRGMMFMRAFMNEDDISDDKMWTAALRRLQFLRRKIIADLEGGENLRLSRY